MASFGKVVNLKLHRSSTVLLRILCCKKISSSIRSIVLEEKNARECDEDISKHDATLEKLSHISYITSSAYKQAETDSLVLFLLTYIWRKRGDISTEAILGLINEQSFEERLTSLLDPDFARARSLNSSFSCWEDTCRVRCREHVWRARWPSITVTADTLWQITVREIPSLWRSIRPSLDVRFV